MRAFTVIGGLFVIAIGLAAFTGSRYDIPSPDPIGDRLFAMIADVKTEYAATFSEEKFSRVGIGMTRNDVESLLGKPLDEGLINGVYVARYSRGVKNSSYWKRVIIYGDGSRVVRIGVGLFGS